MATDRLRQPRGTSTKVRLARPAEITRGTFAIAAEAVPLADVERVWADTGRRIVFVP